MSTNQILREVVDLTDPGMQVFWNTTKEEALSRVGRGDAAGVRAIDGAFALVGRDGNAVRMARSLSVPLRFFIAKRADGPSLVAAHRIDEIEAWTRREGLEDQFHPTYTRMVPAHHIMEVALVGCPDPNPRLERFFSPIRESLPADLDEVGRCYIGATTEVIARWLRSIPPDAPVGVCFSGGVDSGAVFLLTYHLHLTLGLNPSRLKAFTLRAGEGGEDLEDARRFLDALGLGMFLEAIDVDADELDFERTVELIEDYKPLDVQAAAMMDALCRGVRRRYPEWTHLIDGDGGDENLKDYPIEENPELTIRSVLNNRMLYHEGWGVDSIKHSLVHSGGLSRGCTRTFAPSRRHGFRAFSPFTMTDVVEVAEGIPFIELCGWNPSRLYDLKGEIVARGVKAIAGLTMPIAKKRRFQHGVMEPSAFSRRFPSAPSAYRRAFQAAFHG